MSGLSALHYVANPVRQIPAQNLDENDCLEIPSRVTVVQTIIAIAAPPHASQLV